VPAIEAQALEDLFFAQGYVTAQDRLWQMDAMRRFAGENSPRYWVKACSSMIGNNAFSVCGRRRSKRSGDCRRGIAPIFEAYARGVNAYIEEHGIVCRSSFVS